MELYKRSTLLFITIFVIIANTAFGQNYELASPDGNVSIRVLIHDKIKYSVYYKGNEIILPSAISMELESGTLGQDPRVQATLFRDVNNPIFPRHGDFSELNNHFRELKIKFKGNYAIIFRAYNDGIAYRFTTDFQDSLKVIHETAQFNLAGNPKAVLGEAHTLTSWELPYTTYGLVSEIRKGDSAIIPALFSYLESKIKVVLAESDLLNYPGMFILVNGPQVQGFWAGYPVKTVLGSRGIFLAR